MHINNSNLGQRLLFGLLIGVALYYGTLIPITLMGYWRNYLVPSISIFSNFVHVYLIVMVWAFSRSKKITLITTGFVLVGMAGIEFLTDAWPTVAMISKYGIRIYGTNWMMTILPLFLAPILACLFLRNADFIAPRIFKTWTKVYE